jgi:Glycoside Hydrolase Family 113
LPARNEPTEPQLGMSLTAWSASALADGCVRALTAIADLNFNSVTYTPMWFVSTPAGDDLAPRPTVTPNDADLLAAMQVAHQLGLAVTLKPHVEVGDASIWRGMIDPLDRERWWSRYDWMISHHAVLAERGGASTLVIGTELEGLTGDRDAIRWRALVDNVRQYFGGRITLATAKWRDPGRVSFWDALDCIGVNLYSPLGGEHEALPSSRDLRSRWTPYVIDLRGLSERWQLPILVTEIGYRSSSTALYRPWDWQILGVADADRQAAAYDAAYGALLSEPWLQGIQWWDWPIDVTVALDDATSYSPSGKPAAEVAREWNLRGRARATS